MTEEEYCDVRDLQKIESARNILRDIIPEISSVVDLDRYVFIVKTLKEWETALYSRIKTEGEHPSP